jgi:hypothetical protein
MSSPPPGEEEEEESVAVMTSLQLLLPFCCTGAPLPGPCPPPAAEATTFTGAFCIASALLPFLSFPSLFIKPKTTDEFPSGFHKEDLKLIFSKVVQIDLPIVTKE